MLQRVIPSWLKVLNRQHMDLRNFSAAIFVKDINLSRNFYTKVLGLEVDIDMGKNIIFKCGLTTWEINERHVIPALLGKDRISGKSSRFELYFETEDIEEFYHQLRSTGIRFLHEIHEEPWGQRTIRFFDPDDHLIEVGESMESFIGRMYFEGMSIEEISAKTSVPLKNVTMFINKLHGI